MPVPLYGMGESEALLAIYPLYVSVATRTISRRISSID